MITDKDVTKLKKVFVTKNEMKEALKKNTAIIVKEIHTVIEMIGKSLEKDKEQDDILEHHERQIDRINDKVFPTV